jgi:hypothetical protein
MEDRDQNRLQAIQRLELKSIRAEAMGQTEVVKRYQDWAARIRARLGTGPTPKVRKYRGVILGVVNQQVTQDVVDEQQQTAPVQTAFEPAMVASSPVARSEDGLLRDGFGYPVVQSRDPWGV